MIEVTIGNTPNKTVVYFKVFGHIIHHEDYPKYASGSPSELEAVRDAKHRFARKLKTALEEPVFN